MRLEPTNIQQIGNELAIQWNDGTESYLDLQFLRRACPCAACGGEPDVLGNIMRPNVSYSDTQLSSWPGSILSAVSASAALARRTRHRHLQFSISPTDITAGDFSMTTATRFTIIGAGLVLCVGGILIANSSRRDISNTGTRSESIDAVRGDGGYQFAASGSRPKLTFQQLETIIRGDPTAKSQSGRIEFGSVRMEEDSAGGSGVREQ